MSFPHQLCFACGENENPAAHTWEQGFWSSISAATGILLQGWPKRLCSEGNGCSLQIIRPSLLREGFELIQKEGLEVTDDVSIIEALGKPVKLTKGSYTNIKVISDQKSSASSFLDLHRTS